MLADKLKARAQEVKDSNDKRIQEEIVARVLKDASNFADSGQFTMTIQLTLNGWTTDNVEKAATVLRGHGFKCEISRQASRSSLQYDSGTGTERTLVVSWY